MSKKVLTAYFSASGVTRQAAQSLAQAAGADLYEIEPQVKYTAADLDWQNSRSRSSVEMNDPSFRPPMIDTDANIADYDVIFIGFPIWWYVAPTIVNTFLERYDFSGRTVVLFATSGSSGFGKTAAALEGSCPGAKLIPGLVMHNGKPTEAQLNTLKKAANL